MRHLATIDLLGEAQSSIIKLYRHCALEWMIGSYSSIAHLGVIRGKIHDS